MTKSAEFGASRSRIGLRSYRTPTLTEYGSVRELTGGASMLSNPDGGLPGTMNPASDLRVKENIVAVGQHPIGFGLYLFDYKPEFNAQFGRGRQFGVIADEVEGFVPEAVSRDESGYRRVNYEMIGILRH